MPALPPPASSPSRKASALLLILAVCALAGCSVGGNITSTSMSGQTAGARLQSSTPRVTYRPIDINTADIFLTDLPAVALEPGADLSEVSGTLVHIHLFLSPSPGSTPIEGTACSVAIRQFVIAKGQVGLYSGGGFLMPRGTPGDAIISGSIREATLRLARSSPGFVDRLGAVQADIRFRAPRDEAETRRLEVLADRLLQAAK